MSRSVLGALALAGLAAAPYALCLGLGWDADLSVISGGFPTEAQLLHAVFSTGARICALLVAPVFALSAGWRLVLALTNRWTGAGTSHRLGG